MDKDDLSPQEAFDLISSEIQDRMSEYIVAIKAWPEVDPAARIDIWNAVVAKRDEIDLLHRQLSDIERVLRAEAPKTATRAASILYAACQAAGWDVPNQNDERVLARWCQEQVQAIKNPVGRQSALEWIRRALSYAQADRKGPATTCVNNAKQLLDR